ncbi:teneurin-m isoform X3 [Lepeophtheirus salmonis]|uniref:teneurin-m isoform X3 n=1 Tax=Lepeophtheirus salmonis TaxID=72036 RepID=UPI001AE5F100|nr:teneurin-m-like isoform X2 [Lepeophtheirus salmonis]
MESEYNNPYDSRGGGPEPENMNHYEAPSCLVRNPSGSLYIPSSNNDQMGNHTTLDSRLHYDSNFSPHHALTLTATGHRLQSTSSPCRSPDEKQGHIDRSTLSGYNSQALISNTRLGTGTATATGLRRSSPNSSSQYSQSHWRIKKDLGSRCSWKFVAIFFMLLSGILISALVYTTASNFLKYTYESAKACAVVESNIGDNLIMNEINDVVEDSLSQRNNEQVSSVPSENRQNVYESSKRYTNSLVKSLSLPPDGTTFSHLILGQKNIRNIPPYSYWNFQFHQKISSYVELDFQIPRGSSIGIYARKNAIPTLTINDLRDVLTGYRRTRESRTASLSIPTLNRKVSYYMESGHWFISLYNDDGDPQEIEFTSRVAEELTRNCPKGCSNHGECVLGQCQCASGYEGPDCSESICPILCSGNGDYEDGICRCYPGWKGSECHLRHDECEVPECGGRGKCVEGTCLCSRGFNGASCEKSDCEDPSCSGHGFCVDGSCICRKGWRGVKCDVIDNEARQCLPDCSGHGVFDLESQKCICHGEWTGRDCSKERCNLDCGPHGDCESGHCVCQEGWFGSHCSSRHCDPRCSAHGVCSNGTCLCTNGWNGKHCTLEGCPNNCNGHGQCKTNHNMDWECLCNSNWFGKGCDISMEQDCSDKRDNDGDGLTDCADPECCEDDVCASSLLCHTVSKPIDILLRKQPPAIYASFFERMKFIIEDKGLQSYVVDKAFNESRAAVVRGQVVTPSGMGLIGVRVSTTLPNEGFTLTRDDGWFDLMVNGGGPVMLRFGRNPFPSLKLIVYVPWNEVVVLDPVKLSSSNTAFAVPDIFKNTRPCPSHDVNKIRPVVLATWKHGFQGDIPSQSAVLVEPQALQESISLPDSDVFLVHHSARTPGYRSTIQLQLTPDEIPDTLIKVYVKITIEGVVHEKVFEADPSIRYTYAWDRLNEYRQRVYGVTTATVKVGYEYKECDLMWNIQTTKLSGHDMVGKDMGGWNFHVQHRYNYHSGILQRGDGNNVYLKYKPRVVTTLIGDGNTRSLECKPNECNGKISDGNKKLLGPKALTSAPDGSIYLADHNLIRKISPDRTITTLLKLNSSRVSYRFHMSHCTYSEELEQRETIYISQPESHQIIRIKNVLRNNHQGGILDEMEAKNLNVENNWEIVIGSGERCLPGDINNCGDGGYAKNARLAYPKGVAIGPGGRIYIADGNNIRVVNEKGIITTLVGHQFHRSTWKPVPCEGSLPLSEVQLLWPTELAISPLDGSLHFIDDNLVLKLTNDGRVAVVAGRPLHCPPPSENNEENGSLATSVSLIEPQSLSFAPNGDLFLAESNSQRINRIRRIGTDGKISFYAGKDSKCNCLDALCKCFDEDQYLASNAKFSWISSITVAPDGIIYIADQGNYRVRMVHSSVPSEKRDIDGEIFEVPDSDLQEIYVFNKFGQHILTKDIMTDVPKYKMSYTQATSNGHLSSIMDASGRKLIVMRDYKGNVKALQTSNGLKYTLQLSPQRTNLELFQAPSGYKVTFKYHESSGLIKSRLDSQEMAYSYTYDDYGRLIRVISPTGETIGLGFNLTSFGASVDVRKDGVLFKTLKLGGESNVVFMNDGSTSRSSISIGTDKSLTVVEPWGRTTSIGTLPHPMIAKEDPIMGDSFPMPGQQMIKLGMNLISKMEWVYSVESSGQIQKTLRVNGENILGVLYDKIQRREVLFAGSKTELIEIAYDSLSRPLSWKPLSNSFHRMTQTYDRFGRLESWNWGDLAENYFYDSSGRLERIFRGNSTILKYFYPDAISIHSVKVETGSGSIYLLDYEESGGLTRLQTPRGHMHSFAVKPMVGSLRWTYRAPWCVTGPYELHYSSSGFIESKKLPDGDESVTYVYDNFDRLYGIINGGTEVEFEYDSETGSMTMVLVKKLGLEMKLRNKYHMGLLKEQKIRFSNRFFDNAVFRHQYDGNGRPTTMMSIIGSDQEQQSWSTVYNSNTGQVEGISNLRVNRLNHNKTVIQDINNNYFKSVELDGNGRIASIIIGLRRKEMLSLRFEYDEHNRIIKRMTTNFEGRPSEDNFAYTPDGHLLKAWGPINFDYKYDANGNLIGQGQGSRQVSLQYDSGDRVEKIASKRINYDSNGCVSTIGQRKFWFDASGKLSEFISEDETRVSYYYDHLDRLIAWEDSRGRINQYFYANPLNENELTHVHNPKSGSTKILLYDHKGHLVAIETDDQRILVATDQVGSPILVFRQDGSVLKEIRYTPFGQVYSDSNPSMKIPLGFRSGISSIHSSFLHMINEKGVFDTIIVQWLSPNWEKLSHSLTSPLDLFIYRFRNNDPINSDFSFHYADSYEEWTKLFELDQALSFSEPIRRDIIEPPRVPKSLYSSLELISSLSSSVETAKRNLFDLSFVKSSPYTKRRQLNQHFASLVPSFGEGFLLSVIKGNSVVTVLEGIPKGGVVQNILESLLNGSEYLDISYSKNDKSIYFFAKSSTSSFSTDTDNVKRLAGEFSVSSEDLSKSAGGGKDLKISNAHMEIHIFYGSDPNKQKDFILEQNSYRASGLAWSREKALVSAGFSGHGNWTLSQRNELSLSGHDRVRGYEAIPFQSPKLFPELLRDRTNYNFMVTGDLKIRRRKNRHGKRKNH